MAKKIIGLIGKKSGMTRIFDESGMSIPVTVLEVLPNRVTQIKTYDTDGYYAIQVTAFEKKVSNINKPILGHYKKANCTPGIGLWEFRLEDDSLLKDKNLTVGSELRVDEFREGQFVDVGGVSKGKGHAGAIKRWNFSTQDATHGNSLSHRLLGSIGQRQTPGRVFKGKKMTGHLGCEKCTVQNQKIVKVDTERNLLLVRGAVPGAPNGVVIILPAAKRRNVGE